MMEITGTCSSCRCLGKLAGPGRLGDLRSKTCRCQTGSGPAEARLGECDSLPGPCFYLTFIFGKLWCAFGKLGQRRQHRHGKDSSCMINDNGAIRRRSMGGCVAMPSLVSSGRRTMVVMVVRSRHRSSRRDLVSAAQAVAPRVRRRVVPLIASRLRWARANTPSDADLLHPPHAAVTPAAATVDQLAIARRLQGGSRLSAGPPVAERRRQTCSRQSRS